MNAKIECGLRAGREAIPLEGVRVDARLSGACVEVTVTQRYRNRETVPVEAVYVFPLQEGAAVCGFAALISGELVRGKVAPRERAFETYDDAMMQGDGAFLLDQERPNVFTASVGNLRPGESAELQIRYVALASREGDAIRLAIPTTVSPRYVPQGSTEVGQPDGERVNPPHWPQVPYGLQLSVAVEGKDLARVESPSHPVRIGLRDEGMHVELASDDVALDRDFVLLVERKDARQPQARVAREADGRRVAMVTFLPDMTAGGARGHELLFLLDCSGSMDGDSIEQARRALALCVRALGSEDSFNVTRFGSTFESLWKTPRRFDDKSLAEATRYIEQSRASLGGTEILAPLTALLEAGRDGERARRVLLLTDGQVSNEQDVLELARKHAGSARIFAFGIGAGASEHLVRGTARASRGAAEMIFPGERIEPKVLRTFERVRMPALDDAEIDWKGLRVEQAPGRIPPVFACDPLTVFARIEDGTATEVELSAGGQRWRVAFDLERPEAAGPIPTLWAREAIRELEDESAPRRGSAQQRPEAEQKHTSRLIELGTRYQLLCSATSFVAVAERAAADRTTSPAELRRIPVALTTGWGGGGRTLGGAVPAGVVNRPPRYILASAPASAGPMATGFAPPFAARARAPERPGVLGRAVDSVRSLARGMVSSDASGPAQEVDVVERFMSPAAMPTAPSDRLYDLLMTQRADGTFPRSPVLVDWLGSERTQKLDAALRGADERLIVTAVVVLLLERECSDRIAEWKPALAKARAWLSKQATGFSASSIVEG